LIKLLVQNERRHAEELAQAKKSRITTTTTDNLDTTNNGVEPVIHKKSKINDKDEIDVLLQKHIDVTDVFIM
jgi:hypothetical protein